MESLKKIKQIKIIPVVKIDNADMAVPLADSLISGGLPCAEITLRTDAGLDAIRKLSNKDQFLVGAGTVLTVEEADAVCQAGSKFIVSPGFNPKVVDWCLKNKVPVFPGVVTPTDIVLAMEFGLDVLKFFPAEAMGGMKTIKAIVAAYHMISFIPTGGINLENVTDYLSHPQVIACGGSWMVKPEWIKNADFKKIEEETRKTVERIKLVTP